MDKLIQKIGISLGGRIFTLDDQLQFAKFSGDSNPIHIDPILARRTISGECIVHGINGLMYAINSLAKKGISINSFKVQFLRFIPLDTEVQCFWDSEKNRLSIISENTVHTSIDVTLGSILADGDISKVKSDRPLIIPRNITLKECSEITREDLIYRGNIEVGKILFPDLFKFYGDIFAAELALTSEIVGMQVPGLNSLFMSLKGDFSAKNLTPYYELVSCNRFGLIKLRVHGRHLKADIEALLRPCQKKSPSIDQISKKITHNEFQKVYALIIGGSRGLGELTAKIIICGGGKVTVSYNLGEEDAKKLQHEISGHGGTCDITQLRIEDNYDLPKVNFNQIYYFPTPKIRPEYRNFTNTKLTLLYEAFYIHGFRNLLIKILERGMQTSIFYPSSNFLDSSPSDYAGYVESKLKGELLCKEFIESKSMRIIYPRLPRLATDQTLGLMYEEFEDLVDVMYPFIQRMTSLR
jgi:hypothetical protein